jgi:hypothetical protein
MRHATAGLFCVTVFLLGSTDATPGAASYPAMAPLARYLDASTADEISLARSAAPASISGNADVMTLGSRGYVTAVKGNSGFVCVVERSWAAGLADPEFWNPNMRAPTCYNRAAARTVLPRYLERTEWVLNGVSKLEMSARTRAEISANKLMLPEAGAMAYMMSKQGHLNDKAGPWHPHVMFYLANTEAAAWGANLPGAPIFADGSTIFADKGTPEPVIVFFVPVSKWSDDTPEDMKTPMH